jgi:hypothetical protein
VASPVFLSSFSQLPPPVWDNFYNEREKMKTREDGNHCLSITLKRRKNHTDKHTHTHSSPALRRPQLITASKGP